MSSIEVNKYSDKNDECVFLLFSNVQKRVHIAPKNDASFVNPLIINLLTDAIKFWKK